MFYMLRCTERFILNPNHYGREYRVSTNEKDKIIFFKDKEYAESFARKENFKYIKNAINNGHLRHIDSKLFIYYHSTVNQNIYNNHVDYFIFKTKQTDEDIYNLMDNIKFEYFVLIECEFKDILE